MTNELAVIHEMRMVGSVIRRLGLHAHTNEMSGMVQTEIECRGTNFEFFEVHVTNPDQYEIMVIRNTELIKRRVYGSLNEVESALRARIESNKVLK